LLPELVAMIATVMIATVMKRRTIETIGFKRKTAGLS